VRHKYNALEISEARYNKPPQVKKNLTVKTKAYDKPKMKD